MMHPLLEKCKEKTVNFIKFLWCNDQRFYNTVMAISIIGAAWWTITTFDILQQKETALAQLTDLQNRIENTASSNIVISSKVIDYKGKKGVIIYVKIKNNGTDKLMINLDAESLTLYKIDGYGDDIGATDIYYPKFYTKLALLNNKDGKKNKFLGKQAVLINSTKTLTYFVALKNPGLYYATFTSFVDNVEKSNQKGSIIDRLLSINKDNKKIEEVRKKWFSSDYINVEDEQNNKTRIESKNNISAVYFTDPDKKLITMP